MEKYDVVVIGGGIAGITAAKYAASRGKKVALIERNRLGGVCTWSGCAPSKALLKVAALVHNAKKLPSYGVETNDITFDFKKVLSHVCACMEHIYQTQDEKALEKLGITVIFGSPSFTNATTLSLAGKTIQAKKYIIATGSQAYIPPIDGINKTPYLTPESFFSLTQLPRSIVILGAGPVGIELGSALIRLGVETTIIQADHHILPHEEPDLSQVLRQQLEKEGLAIKTGLKAIKVTIKDNITTLHAIDAHENLFTFKAEHLLLAVGRTAQTQSLGLEKAGVFYSSNGIAVDNTLCTSVKHIYACGDVAGPYKFSHMAAYQARIAAHNTTVSFWKRRVNYNQVLWVTFCDPEFACAGLTEQEAKKQYGHISIVSVLYSELDRAKIDHDETGVAKFILDKRGRIVGASILGHRAGEVLHEIQLGKYYRIPLRKYYTIIHAYPTYSEIVWKAAKKAHMAHLQRNWFLRMMRFLFYW